LLFLGWRKFFELKRINTLETFQGEKNEVREKFVFIAKNNIALSEKRDNGLYYLDMSVIAKLAKKVSAAEVLDNKKYTKIVNINCIKTYVVGSIQACDLAWIVFSHIFDEKYINAIMI